MKAPEFEGIPGFDKKLNNLFEIRTRVTDAGYVFVNFDAGEEAQEFDVEALKVMESCKIGSCNWVNGWTLEGDFNWKISGMNTCCKYDPKQKAT